MTDLQTTLAHFSNWLDRPIADWFTLVLLKFLVAFMLLLAARSHRHTALAWCLRLIGIALFGDLVNSSIKQAPPMTWPALVQYTSLLVAGAVLTVKPHQHARTAQPQVRPAVAGPRDPQ